MPPIRLVRHSENSFRSAELPPRTTGHLHQYTIWAKITLPRFFNRQLCENQRAIAMFSVQKYFSHDAKFFDLLEASADETQALTRLLVELLKDRTHPHPLHEFALARDKDKRITDQISHELVNTFVTGLEREDIETLSYSMYRICKVIEKFAERFNLSPQKLEVVDFTRQAELMKRATETLSQMVR